MNRIVTACAWCKRIRTVDGIWETATSVLPLHPEELVSHGICPECSLDVQGLGEHSGCSRQNDTAWCM